MRMDENKKRVLEIIIGSSHEEQSDISTTMDDIDNTGKEKLFPRFHINVLRSLRSDLLNPKFGSQKSALL